MKQKLLLVSAALLFGVTVASATVTERTVPEVPESSFSTVVTDGATAQYLYNVELKGFLRGANNWQTRATIYTENGAPFKITALDGGTYVLTDSVFKFKEYRNMFADGNEGIWVDNNSGPNYDKWTITAVEGKKTYYIGNTAYEGTYLGGVAGNVCTKGSDGATDVGIYCNLENPSAEGFEDFKYEWAMVSRADYSKHAESLVLYAAAAPLYTVLVEAANAGVPAESLAPYENIYNNLNSTKEELETAIKAVQAMIDNVLYERWKHATLSDPVEITSLIANTQEIEGSSTNGDVKSWKRTHTGTVTNGTFHVNTWSTEGNSDGTNMTTPFIEDWNAAGTVLSDQVVYHDTVKVAPGAYRITASIRCFNESAGAESMSGISMFANFNKVDLLTQVDEVIPFINWNDKLILWKEDFEVYAVVGNDSALTFGMIIKDADFNWLAAKNFHIYALGASDESVVYAHDKNESSVSELDEETYVTVSLAEGYNEAVNKYLESKTAAEILAAAAKVNNLKPAIDANIAAWKKLLSLRDRAEEVVNNGDVAGQAVADLNQYLENTLRDILGDREILDEEIYKVCETLLQMITEAEKGLVPGSKVKIENYDFASGEQGWTFQKANGGNVAANASAKCAEGWNNSNFDIYQMKEGVPAGVYRLTVQGFYRYKRGNEAWNAYFDEFGDKKDDSPKSTAYVYLNDKKKALMNVFEFKAPVGELYTATGDLAAYTDPLGEYHYPNGMADAGLAFDQGEYRASAIGVVAKDGDPLRIGMKGNTEGDCWAIFTRFELVYLGYDADSIKQELNNELNNLKYGLVGKEIEEAIAKIKADAAAAGSDGMKMFEVLSSLYVLEDSIEISEEIFADLKKANEDLYATLSDENLNARRATIEQAMNLYAQVDEAITNKSFTTQEAKEAAESIKLINKKLGIPANIDEASDENPAELTKIIVNNSFETGDLTGWTYAQGTGDTGSKKNDNATYTIANADGSYVFNTWSGSAIEGGFFVSQEITDLDLPVGIYELKVLVASDANNTQTVSANNGALMTTTVDKGTGIETSVFFSLETVNEPIAIKVASQSWFKADNFQLFYYGANSKHTVGLDAMEETKVVAVEIFDANGMKLNALKKGINVIRTVQSNGTVVVKKVSVK